MSCECTFKNNEEVLEKVISKGLENEKMEYSYNIDCPCGESNTMDTYVMECSCGNKFAVTPCKSDDKENIVIILAK